jgi:hypothetical protein
MVGTRQEDFFKEWCREISCSLRYQADGIVTRRETTNGRKAYIKVRRDREPC